MYHPHTYEMMQARNRERQREVEQAVRQSELRGGRSPRRRWLVRLWTGLTAFLLRYEPPARPARRRRQASGA